MGRCDPERKYFADKRSGNCIIKLLSVQLNFRFVNQLKIWCFINLNLKHYFLSILTS